MCMRNRVDIQIGGSMYTVLVDGVEMDLGIIWLADNANRSGPTRPSSELSRPRTRESITGFTRNKQPLYLLHG